MHTLTKLRDDFCNCQKCMKSPLGGQLFLWFKGHRKLTVCPGPKPGMFSVFVTAVSWPEARNAEGNRFVFRFRVFISLFFLCKHPNEQRSLEARCDQPLSWPVKVWTESIVQLLGWRWRCVSTRGGSVVGPVRLTNPPRLILPSRALLY